MNCKFTNVIVFAVGAAIGSAVTWKVTKTRYERIVQEEIESVKEAFFGMQPSAHEQSEEDTDEEDEERPEQLERPHQINWKELEDLDEEYDPDDDDLNEYEKLVNKYTNEKGGATEVAKEPYVISPYDFNENGFRVMELTYYADDILEDEDHEIVTDVDELLGKGSLNTFGEYEDDSVFVRNEKLKIDFQILRDPRTYEEATGKRPVKVSD